MPVEVIRLEDQPVALRVRGQEFPCDVETGQTTIPKEFLTDFRLSEIPDNITIKPVKAIDGNTIHSEHDVELCRFADGSASALVEEMFRRKFWDGEVGLSPYVAALRESIGEHEATTEADFQDDDDYIFLHYEITITEDLEIAEAMQWVESVIVAVQERAEQLVARRRDRLLGIFDRGSFDADLAHALRGPKHGVALLMIDIDHFKQVNDTHGHQVGDAVLQAVARFLQERCQHGAVPYRYGGEELAIVQTETNKPESIKFAELLRAGIETLIFANPPELRVTVSIGIAVAPDDGHGTDELLKNADDALYAAKDDGRNRVRCI